MGLTEDQSPTLSAFVLLTAAFGVLVADREENSMSKSMRLALWLTFHPACLLAKQGFTGCSRRRSQNGLSQAYQVT